MAARPLRLLLTLQTVLVVLLPFAMVVGLGVGWLLPELRSEIEAQQSQLARAVASQAESYLTASMSNVQVLASMLSVDEHEGGGHLQQVLDAQLQEGGALRAIYVTGPMGRVKAVALGGYGKAQREDLLDMDMSRNQIIKDVREQGGPVWSDTFLSVVGGGLSVALATPSGDSTVIGELRLDNLSRYLQHISTVPQQLVLVLDRRGQIIADQEGRYTAQQLNISDIPMVSRGLSGAQTVLGPLKFQGVAMIGSMVKVPTLDWHVLVALPARVSQAPMWTIFGIFAAALAMTLLAGTGAAVWLSRRMAGRFENLAGNARLIASGQEVVHWPVSSILEFQTLAGDLQTMAQAVRQREQSLSLSEAKVRRLIHSSPLGLHLYRLSADGRLTLSEANPAADAILRLGHNRLLGQEIQEAFPGLAHTDLPQRCREVASQGGLWQDDQIIYAHDNVKRTFEVRAFQSEPGQVAMLFNDITQRKQAEEDLRQSEARYEKAQAMAHVGNWEVDLISRAAWGSDEARRIYGLTELPQALSWDQILARIHPEDREARQRAMAEFLELRAEYDIEYRIVIPESGEIRYIHSLAEAERDKSGRPVRLMGTLQDITQVKLAQQEKAELETRLRQSQKMEAVGTLAGGIAHDFNNILAIILGNADMALEDAPPGTPLAEMLERIQSACQRGKGLVTQILAFSRQKGRQPVAVEPAIIWKETLKLLKSTLPADIRIEQRLGAGGCKTLADPTELHQVLLNLCTNASHAMRQEGGVLTVALAETLVREADGPPGLPPSRYVRLTVRDTGQGMDQATQERIFEPYFSTKAPGEGTGLGLAVVHGLLQSYGGAITVQSQPGQGTTFEVYLPLVEGPAAASAGEPQALPRGTGRILVVDDEPEVLAIGTGILTRLGYQVTRQTDGVSAWQAFQEDPQGIDLVITDQAMPKLSGLGLARRIRALPSRVPIILCTGFLEPRLEEEATQLGIDHVLHKPYSRVRLAGAVQLALAGRQRRETAEP